ncbi:MAG: hypothetical protein RTU63_05390 [Candidatus Thorarchaeota archaeon]
MAKKKKSKPKLSPAMFKVTGAHKKLKIDSKKKKLYYFGTKIKPEKAKKVAGADGADILGVSLSDVKVSKPAIKYDFYCLYDANLELKFLRINKHDFGVNEQVKGTLVGKEVITPKKKGGFHSISLDVVELFEIKRKDGMILDGKTGGPANALEKVLKGPGKKGATAAWIRKNKISPGKYNSIDKVVKAVAKMAGAKPSGAKRITDHSLTFKKLEGYYVPVYYVKVKAGAKTQTLKINAVNGAVSVAV